MALGDRTVAGILSENPGLKVVRQHGRNIFYEPPINHILAGYFVDYGSTSTYFGWVCVPLCDVILHVGPGFGGRLPRVGGQIGDMVSAAELPTHLKSFVELHRQSVDEIKETRNFLEKFRSSDSLKNEKLGRSFATVLILEELFDQAYDLIAGILKLSSELRFRPDWMEPFLIDTNLLLSALEKKPARAVEIVLAWKSANKDRFDILSS